MFLEDVIVHIIMEERNRNLTKVAKAKEQVMKANLVKDKPNLESNKKNSNMRYDKFCRSNKKLKANNPTFKKKGTCFVYGKPEHYAPQFWHKRETITLLN